LNYYKQYMDRQALSPEFLEQLEHCSRRPRGRWRRWGALAACCLLLAGLGLHMSRPAQTTPVELPQTAEPAPEKGRLWTEPPPPYVQDNTEKRVVEDTEPAATPPAPALEMTLSPETKRYVPPREGRGRPKMDRRPGVGDFDAERRKVT